MNKDKVKSLDKYKQDLENRLSSPVPEKHKNNPESFKQFLKNELQSVSLTIQKLKGLE